MWNVSSLQWNVNSNDSEDTLFLCVSEIIQLFESKWSWNPFLSKDWYSCHFCSSFDDLPSQGWEPKEDQLYAEHDRGPNRVCPVILWVPPSPPTANFQIIFWGTLAMEEHKGMCVCMYVKVVRWRSKDSPAVAFTSLRKSSEAKVHHSNQAIYDGERRNWFWCLFSTFCCAESPY